MRLLLCSIFCCAALFCKGQGGLSPQGELRDAYGQPVSTKNVYGVEGSPYLKDIYQPGNLTLNGSKYSNLRLKLNLEKSTVYFEKNGAEMIPIGTVSAIEFIDAASAEKQLFRSGFPEINKNHQQTFYQVIDSGKAILLKHIGVKYSESRQYGEATTIKRYEQVASHYVFHKNTLVQAKKIDALIDLLSDKKSELEKFISSNKIKLNRDEDVKALISFYNKL